MYRLREIERRDLNKINNWRNDEKLISYLGAPFRFINYEVDVNWFNNYMANRMENVRCAIVNDSCDEILGIVSLTSINFQNQSAEFQIMVGDSENQNKGAGTYAVNRMLWHAFNNLNLQRVELCVLADNKRAIHLYEKCGFVYEGRKRKANYKDGKFVDLLIYSILRCEYDEEMSKGVENESIKEG